MGSVNLVVVVESVRSIIDHKSGDLNEFHIPSLVAVGAALGELLFLTPRINERISPSECSSHFPMKIGVKVLLFIYCYALRKSSSQVRMLWEDHRNDLWINGFGKFSFADPLLILLLTSGLTTFRHSDVRRRQSLKMVYVPSVLQYDVKLIILLQFLIQWVL